jgi:arylsulfatase A
MRILISIVIVLAVVAAPLVVARPAHSAERPNILFILVDDVGREVLGCYGGESYKTPNIDRLAESGLRFEHAYVMPMCHPTRICLMTGQYPFRLGEPRWGVFPKQFEQNSLGNVLKRAGYATAISGKWQLTLLKNDPRQPNRMGFDEYCLDAWHEGPWYHQPRIWQDGRLREDIHDRYGPDVTCDYLIEFLRQHREQPFFANYTMELCHDETNDLDKPAPVGPSGRYETYAERVPLMDERIGRVMKALEETGLRDRTLVLFLADNGTPPKSLNDADGGKYIFEDFTSRFKGRDVRGGKGTLTDWGTRVPMIVSWPKRIPPGRSDALVDASDILPTLAEISGAQIPLDVKLDGHSIADFLLRGGTPDRKWVFAEYNGRGCVRNHRWKLYSDGKFYDVGSDADETSPLAVSKLSDDANRAYQELTLAMNGLGYVKQDAAK